MARVASQAECNYANGDEHWPNVQPRIMHCSTRQVKLNFQHVTVEPAVEASEISKINSEGELEGILAVMPIKINLESAKL